MTRPPPELVLAVDSGGSGTRVRHGSDDRVVELPAVAWHAPDVPAALAAMVVDGWARLGRPATALVALGIAATPSTEEEVERLARPLGESLGAADVLIANDALTGHLGALGGGWGVSLVVGTGIACVGVGPAEGALPVVVDGYGYLLGDLGSAYWIGRHAVRTVLDADVLGEPATALTAAVVGHLGPLPGLAYRLHARSTAVADLAALAPAVADLVDRDPAAHGLMERAARHLAATAARAAGLLGAADTVPVALGGRVLTQGGWLADRVAALLADQPVPVAVRNAAGSPLDGVTRLAGLAVIPPGVQHWKRAEAR
jgi:glucosamine kinase